MRKLFLLGLDNEWKSESTKTADGFSRQRWSNRLLSYACKPYEKLHALHFTILMHLTVHSRLAFELHK